MRISRIAIHNFRNFSDLDVRLGRNAVIVGENKIGKSNLVYALRLILDPALPDSARQLREEDFWDGLNRPLGTYDCITVTIEIADFENNAGQLAILGGYLVETDPMVARLTYVFQPLPGLNSPPKKDSDYEFILYGGERPENRIIYEVRRRLPLELIPALRDCEGDLARWTRSPLRPLLDKAASNVDSETLTKLAKKIDKTTQEVSEVEDVKAVATSVQDKLKDMVGDAQSLDVLLRFSPTDPNKLIRALRMFIDDGRRSISDASLGSANLIYLALKMLEYRQLSQDGDRDHTFLSIEEPEAHLHPNLQRLIFRSFLRTRLAEDTSSSSDSTTILMTTHSPHVASVTPIKDFVLLKRKKDNNSTEAISTAEIPFDDDDIADLERYIDVNRGEILFARAIILVEGDAEKFLIPVIANNLGYNLDELGISVCSVSGTNFVPYLLLIGPQGLNLPYAVLTDKDPQWNDTGEQVRALSVNRVIEMTKAILGEDYGDEDVKIIWKNASHRGIFVNTHTLEIDLFNCGLHCHIAETMKTIPGNKAQIKRFNDWVDNPENLDDDTYLSDIKAIGKGRFAQRLACIIGINGDTNCPNYIRKGIKHVADQCIGY